MLIKDVLGDLNLGSSVAEYDEAPDYSKSSVLSRQPRVSASLVNLIEDD
jgi:hypothetical protein